MTLQEMLADLHAEFGKAAAAFGKLSAFVPGLAQHEQEAVQTGVVALAGLAPKIDAYVEAKVKATLDANLDPDAAKVAEDVADAALDAGTKDAEAALASPSGIVPSLSFAPGAPPAT